MSEWLIEKFVRSHATPPTEIVLDFDATDDPRTGSRIDSSFTDTIVPMVFCCDACFVAVS